MKKGFTLIEIMVAVSIFVIVALVTTGAFITANNINKKAQAIKLVMDNLNFALDSMSLKIRKGINFNCQSAPTSGSLNNFPVSNDSSANCPDGDNLLSFSLNSSVFPPPSSLQTRFAYWLNDDDGRLYYQSGEDETDFGGNDASPITMDEAEITNLKIFHLQNANVAAGLHPLIRIVISGKVSIAGQESEFALQTSVSPR